MKKILNAGILGGIVFLASCGAPAKDGNPNLAEKKAHLQQLRQQQDKLTTEIQKLENDIATLDPSSAVKPKLVNITALSTQNFTHYIDLQGKINTKNIYYVSPRGQGGQVKAVYVKEGDNVKKGQLLIKLDDAVMLQNLQQLQTQLSYAQDLYNRQKNLWDQKIGTEVQLITAKNNVDNLEKQISVLKEQWNSTNVYAEVSGVVETVNIHTGEFFNGSALGGISIVNQDDLKAVVEVPENYLSSVKKGTPVVVEVPDVNQHFNTNISLVSQLISNNSRTFTAEAKIPAGVNLKPNQVAMVKIEDYAASNVIVIPITSLQTDEGGKFVFVATMENGKLVAKKRNVTVGSVYGEKIEVKQGLQAGDQLISEGFQGLYDGQSITTS
ncbi:MAG TPA: efflux RND transporter periplasmic adaptor subunit [Puia sp.]|nr:efflux RND transporter periplasmic adaptor subunit [Puia sp.]